MIRKILPLLFLALQVSAADGADKKEFQQILTSIGNENPKILSADYQRLSTRASQLANLLSWTPKITASGAQALPTWGLDGGDTAALEVRMNLFRFGGDYARVRDGQKTDQQADLKFQLAVLDVESKAAQLLFQWISVQRGLASQKSFWNSKKELTRVAQERFKRGQLPSQEVDKVRLDASNSEIQIRQAEVDLLSLKSDLEALLPGASRVQTWPWSGIAKTTAKKSVKPLGERFNFQNLMLETEIRGHRSWEATANWLPSIDLLSTWQTNQIKPIRSGDWTSFLTLTIPIWDQGASWAGRGQWAEAKRAAEQDLEVFKREESAKLQTLDERREKLRQNLLVALESSEKSKNLVNESLRRFQLGRASVNDLLIDQQRLFDSENLTEQAQLKYHLVLLESCLAADERPSRCF